LWTGVISTLLFPRFWLLMGLVVSPGQAKRLYPLVGAGALVGASLGALAAAALLHYIHPRALLFVAAAIFLGTAFLVPAFGRPSTAAAPAEEPGHNVAVGARLLASQTYLRRLLLLTLATTVTVTVVDYLFKSGVAAAVPPHELGRFLAKTYAVLPAVAL